jgi:hypothetical protein
MSLLVGVILLMVDFILVMELVVISMLRERENREPTFILVTGMKNANVFPSKPMPELKLAREGVPRQQEWL